MDRIETNGFSFWKHAIAAAMAAMVWNRSAKRFFPVGVAAIKLTATRMSENKLHLQAMESKQSDFFSHWITQAWMTLHKSRREV